VARGLRQLLADERIRYLVCGAVVAVTYLSAFAAFSYGFPRWGYFLVFALAQALAITVAFPLYRRFVFASTGSWHGDLRRFLSVWGVSLVVSAAGLPLLVELVGVSPVVSQVILVAVVAVGSFLGHRYFSFKHRAATAPVSVEPAGATSPGDPGTTRQSPPAP
jgi:putative flippase GtrA